METTEHPSPDGSHVLRLEHVGEIRFGPPYYCASLDGRALEHREFGWQVVWSEDGRYCALQLWNTTRESDGPDTSLFLIRVADLRYYDLPRVRHGFLDVLRFEGSTVVYAKNRSTTEGRILEFEMDVEAITGWRELFPVPYLPG